MSLEKVVPSVKAQEPDEEEDLVDPMDELREKCREDAHSKHLQERLEECNARVESRSRTTETCAEELFDLLHHVDHCVSKTLFTILK